MINVEPIRKRSVGWYGWVPDIPDHRDKYYSLRIDIGRLPTKVDLRESGNLDFPIYDQGNLGSCTANAIGAAIDFDMLKQGKKPVLPSRLFVYYCEREVEGTIYEDSGAMIRDGIKCVNKLGACHEVIWPYDTYMFTRRPSDAAYVDAALHQALAYARVSRDLKQFKGVLASGFPFVFGFAVYESFESLTVATTGVADLPLPDEQQLGGHAVLAVGYDDLTQRFLVRNSWGEDWGKSGYFTLPYEYLTDGNLSDDFWVIRLMEESNHE